MNAEPSYRLITIDEAGAARVASVGPQIDAALLKDLLGERKTLFWLDIHGFGEPVEPLLRDIFGFHPLSIEDAGQHHFPKVDFYGDQAFVVWYGAAESKKLTGRLTPLAMWSGANFLVTVHKKKIAVLDDAAASLERGSVLVEINREFLLHLILDATTCSFFPVLDAVSDRIDSLQEIVFEEPSDTAVKQLFEIKHGLLAFKKISGLQRDAAAKLVRSSNALVNGESRYYYDDLYDDLIRVDDRIETARELIGAAVEIYLSSHANRLSDITSKLTVIATIFLPLTFVVGLYGMNFTNRDVRGQMPEFFIPYFYHGLWLAMLLLVGGLLMYFRRKKWF